MQITMLKSKLHHARVTESELEYPGSLGIDRDFMDDVHLRPYEKILIANMKNGSRFETYAIPAERGSKTICLNGATAHLGDVGDRLIIFAFAIVNEEEAAALKPRVLVFGEGNEIIDRH